jgi:hypothetical protein
MIIIRCTAKLRKELGVRDSELSDREDDGFLGSWYSNLLWIDRRKCILVTNSVTLYSFLVPGVPRSQLQALDVLFASSLLENLESEGVGQSSLDAIRSECMPVFLSKTKSKSVLGSMNDLVYQIDATIRGSGGLSPCDVGDLNRRLNRTPMGAIGYAYPIDMLREELRSLHITGR